MIKKILVTGGTGRFGSIIKNLKTNHKMFFPNKNILDITSFTSIQKYIKLKKPDIVIHLAGLSRPMNIHDLKIKKSIDLNIIGTSNITKACAEKNIKLIFFSTNYVYPGKKGNYKETDALLPFNNYAWSKLGGECAVQMYKNSLILHVDDLASAVFFILNKVEQKDKRVLKVLKKNPYINIGSSKEYTIKQYANMIAKLFPKKINLKFNKKYPDGTPRKLLNNSIINSIGWKPKISINRGLKETIEWYKKNINKFVK